VGAQKALKDLPRYKPLILPPPIEMEVEFVGTQQADRAQLVPDVERIGPQTVRAQGANFLEIYRLFLLMLR